MILATTASAEAAAIKKQLLDGLVDKGKHTQKPKGV